MMTPSARHIRRVFERANSAQLRAGIEWYSAAHTFARGLSERYGLELEQAAGIIAAISPRLLWSDNMKRADDVARTGTCRGLRANVAKAEAIRDGAPVSKVLQCPQCVRSSVKHVCSGQKVRAFYAVIMSAGECDAVCVDRHAFDIAVGRVTDDITRKQLDRVGQYERVANAYRRAGVMLGVSACVVQAVTWVVWREL